MAKGKAVRIKSEEDECQLMPGKENNELFEIVLPSLF